MRPVEYTTSPIYRRGHPETEIIVEDNDADGLFNWGIGPRPAFIPLWSLDEDGDDSDSMYGKMDEYGFLQPINTFRTYSYIDTNSTYSGIYYITSHLALWRNSTLTVTGQLSFGPAAKLLIDQGCTLIVDGGTICNAILRPQEGCHIILRNGGRIQLASSENFELPLGATLDIENGSIDHL